VRYFLFFQMNEYACHAVTDISPPAIRLLTITAAYFIFNEAMPRLAI
jgi:hypothetical protein